MSLRCRLFGHVPPQWLDQRAIAGLPLGQQSLTLQCMQCDSYFETQVCVIRDLEGTALSPSVRRERNTLFVVKRAGLLGELPHRETRSIDIARDSNCLVFGAPATGKTIAFSMPLIADWFGPVVYFTVGATYPGTGDGRESFGDIRTLVLDNQPLSPNSGRLELPALDIDTPARLGTLLVTASIRAISELLTRDHSVARTLAQEVVAGATRAIERWKVDAALQTLKLNAHMLPRPLIILDDYWAQTSFVSDILESTRGPGGDMVRLVFVSQYAYAMRKRLGEAVYAAVLERCQTVVQFEQRLAELTAGLEGTDDEKLHREQVMVSGSTAEEIRALGRWQAIVRRGDGRQVCLFEPRFRWSPRDRR